MCEYCEQLNESGEGPDIIYDDSWTDRFNMWKDNEGNYRIECYASQSSPINYCPMCGRNLKEADDGND
jgi:hypothetical protein